MVHGFVSAVILGSSIAHTLRKLQGVMTGDEESYNLFADLLNPIISEWHNGYNVKSFHHTFADTANITDMSDLDSDYVLSCRVCVARSLHGYNYPVHCSRAERRQIEDIFLSAMKKLDSPFQGKYFPVRSLSGVLKLQLDSDTMLCDKVTCPLWKSAGITHDWPDGRGVWITSDQRFIVWLNDKQHIRFVWREAGGNVYSAFEHIYEAVAQIEKHLEEEGLQFQYDEHLGYLLGCPTEIGTGLCVEVHARLPHFRNDGNRENVLEALRLKERCKCLLNFEEVEKEDITMYISNKDTLGRTEIEILQHVIESVNTLIAVDKRLYEQDYTLAEVGYDDLLVSLIHPLENYPDLSNHHNWLAECLTPQIYSKLVGHGTESGFTFDQCIQTGVDNPSHPYMKTIGAIAGDEETYTVFADLINIIVEKCHQGYSTSDSHVTNLDYTQLGKGIKLDDKYVVSCRLLMSRNFRGLCLPPHCCRAERHEVELIVSECLNQSTDDDWNYTTLKDVTEEERQQLSIANIMFDKPYAPMYACAGITRDWPHSRGLYYNTSKTTAIWVNEKDHIRFVVVEKGGNISAAFINLCEQLEMAGTRFNEKEDEFMMNSHFGYITSCPSHLGTGMTCSVIIKLKYLSQLHQFQEVMDRLLLHQEKLDLEDSPEDGNCLICKESCLGVSEVEQIENFASSVSLLIKMEKRCEKNKSIADLIPENIDKQCEKESLQAEITMSDFPDLELSQSLLKEENILTEDVYDSIKSYKTGSGFTIDDCIQFAVDAYCTTDDIHHQIGLVAADEECYTLFAPIFESVASKVHYSTGYSRDKKHPTQLSSKKLSLTEEFDSEFIGSCRISAVRCIRPYPLASVITRQERRDVEDIIFGILMSLKEPYAGKYVTELTHEEEWSDIPLCFKKPDWKHVSAALIGRDWPDARGIWLNDSENFFVLINEEEHMKVVCHIHDSDMKETFDMFCDGMNKIENALKKQGHQFMWNKNLGYLQSDITHIGTGMYVGMGVKLHLLKNHPLFEDILLELSLKCDDCDDLMLSGESYVHVHSVEVWGLSEVDIVQKTCDAILMLINLEKKLLNQESIDDFFQNSLD